MIAHTTPLLIALLLCAGCGAFSDQTLVTNSPTGAVYLQQLSNRGTTVRYSGPLKSFKASHPIDLSPDTLAKAFARLSIGIREADGPRTLRGIKPVAIFSTQQTAFLAQAVATALKRAQPDHRIKFQVGSSAEVTDGTLYVDGPALHIAFSHYRSPADRPDEQLTIYTLSFEPENLQARSAAPQTWMEIEPDHLSIALAYDQLGTLPPVPPPATPAASPGNQATEPTPPIKSVVDKQAQELEALRAELEALKKQLAGQDFAPKSKGAPKLSP